MNVIKTEPEVDPLAIQTSNDTYTEVKRPLSEDESYYLDNVKKELVQEVIPSEDEILTGSNSTTYENINSSQYDSITREEHMKTEEIPNKSVCLEKASSTESLDNDELFTVEDKLATQTSSQINYCSIRNEASGSSDELIISDTFVANSDVASGQSRRHTSASVFECGYCGMCFTRSGSLNTHARTHTGEKLFKCKDCGKCFNHSSDLNMHIRMETGDNRFKCDVCGKCYAYLSNLRSHARIHSGDRPFKCDVCGNSYPYLSNLKTHARTHTGEKPFKCDECGKRFPYRSSLILHGRIHSGEKPFKCVFCGKCFVLLGQLKRHSQSYCCEKLS